MIQEEKDILRSLAQALEILPATRRSAWPDTPRAWPT